jgi:hypothetical protein
MKSRATVTGGVHDRDPERGHASSSRRGAQAIALLYVGLAGSGVARSDDDQTEADGEASAGAMRTLLVSLAALAAIVLAAPRDAQACDCAHGEPTVADARGKLATIVHGRVVAARDRAAGHGHEIDLYVVRAWSGATAGAVVTIAVDASSCGYFFAPGDEALIFAPATGELEQCAGDRTARVATGAAIAVDAAALGPPTSQVTMPATSPGPTADVVIEGTVTQPMPSYRPGFRVRVTKATTGATRRETLDVYSATGCPIAVPATGSRVAVRAVRVRRQLVTATCLDGLGVRVVRPPPRRPRRP